MRQPALARPLAAAVLGLLLAACGRPAQAPSPAPSPASSSAPSSSGPGLPPALASLRAPAYDPDFGLAFWTARLDARTIDPSWSRALAFCRGADPARYPNCRTVRLLATASRIPGFATPAAVEPADQEPTP